MFRIAVLVAVLLLAVAPSAVLAHTRLESSVPADGAVVRPAVPEIRLRFSTRVEPSYTRIALIGPGGEAFEVGALQPMEASGEQEYFVALEAPLQPGDYTVRWQTAGADGHVIEGSFRFTVEPDPAAPPPELPPPDATGPEPGPAAPPEPAAASPPVPVGSPLATLVRWVNFLGLLGIIGAVTFRLGVIRSAGADSAVREVAASAVARSWWVGVVALGVSVVALVLRLWRQSATLHGVENAWSGEHLSTLISTTTWGHAWLLQVGGTAVFLIGLLIARRAGPRPVGWYIAAGAVLVLVAVPALSGHAAAVERLSAISVLSDTLHVLGGGVWLGTLGVLLAAGIPAALSLTDGSRSAAVAVLVRRFTPVALTGAGIVGLTGIVNALFHIAAPAQLWSTSYGQTLLIKLGVLTGVVALGFYNWRRVKPSLGTEDATQRLRRSAGAEIAIGALVVLITAVLVARPTP